MSILKFESSTPRNLQDMYSYMIDREKTAPQFIFGIGVNPINAVQEMKLIQHIHGYYNLVHEYKQVIFCFDTGVKLEESLIKKICWRIGEVLNFGDKRQIVGAIHGIGTDRIHCHYMINYVGIDGALLRQKYSVIHYKNKVNELLQEYGLTPIYYYGSEYK